MVCPASFTASATVSNWRRLLELAGIAGTPCLAFGQSREGQVRFSIATAMSDLEKAVERLAPVVEQL